MRFQLAQLKNKVLTLSVRALFIGTNRYSLKLKKESCGLGKPLICVFTGLLLSTRAIALDLTQYFPTTAGATWMYATADSFVDVGSCNGRETVSVASSSPSDFQIASRESGCVEESSLATIHFDGSLFATVSQTDLTSDSPETTTFNPALPVMPATADVGQRFSASGIMTSTSSPATAPYSITIEIAAIEDITVPAGFFPNAVKVITKWHINGDNGFGDSLILDTSYQTWYARGVGEVKQISEQLLNGAPDASGRDELLCSSLLGTSGIDCGKNLGDEHCENLCGNPINIGSGNKFQREKDYKGAGHWPLTFERFYNSNGVLPPGTLGTQWRHTYDRSLMIGTDSASFTTVRVERPNGQTFAFDNRSGDWRSTADVIGRLISLTDSTMAITGWQFVDADDITETYSADGRLLSLTNRQGQVVRLTYNNSQHLQAVTDPDGRSLMLSYDSDGKLVMLTIPGEQSYLYSYDSNARLASVKATDGTIRRYLYNESANTAQTDLPNALTGIIDENDSRFATYGYDAEGRAVSSEHAGGTQRVSIIYNADGSRSVTDALNTHRVYTFNQILGALRLNSVAQPCSTCGGTSVQSTQFDAQGNANVRSDFNGSVTNYVYDISRNLETSRTEAAGTPQARTITTQWHATYRLPLLVTEPGRSTAYNYDAKGNLLSKTITDTATSSSRTWSYTYNTYGQVLTADGPRTDVSDVTTYTYYDCTTGSECGQVHTVTNALGQVTTFATYNTAGQPLSVIDANGVTTTLSYDARQRLLTRSVAGETTAFAYWPTGLLKQVTLPDASTLTYNYDAAHRLTSVVDSEGSSLVYTLDAAGNRTQEKALDATGNVVRSHSRVFDALSRLAQELGAASQSTSYAYDNNGNLLSVTDPASHTTTYQYDALNRLAALIDPALHTTGYGYDAQDNLTQVTDPKNLTTSYTYNGLGDLTQLTSPDTGVTQYVHDTAGNLDLATDARAKSGDYSYDALGRITQIQYSDQTQTFTYDQGANAKGRLTQVTDSSGNTQWTYSPQGRVLSKANTIGSLTKTIGYGYNSAGQLSTVTTPSGQAITYSYANGKLSGMAVNGTTVLNQVLYSPFGPTQGWTWGNNTLTVREYDQDGQLTTVDSAGLSTYTYNADGTIASVTHDSSANIGLSTGLTNLSVSTTSNQLTSSTGVLSRTYSYDAAGNTQSDGTKSFTYNDAGRMTSATNLGITTTYQYNALGQRVSKSNSDGTTYFVYDEAGHLLGEYDQAGALIQEIVWLDDIPVATIRTDQGGTGVGVFYVHTDHLNAPTKIIRPINNEVIWRWDHDPYGNGTPNQDPDGNGLQLTMNLRFPGQYQDQETGLNYNYHRDYDPQTGRYVESDPIGLTGRSFSTYSYANGDPVFLTDPKGECPPNSHSTWNIHDGFKCVFDDPPSENSSQCTTIDCLVYPPETNCSFTIDCYKKIIKGGAAGGLILGQICGKVSGVPVLGGMFCKQLIWDYCGTVNRDKCNNGCSKQ